MVILDGDPLANVTNLLNVAVVIKGGEVVVERRETATGRRRPVAGFCSFLSDFCKTAAASPTT